MDFEDINKNNNMDKKFEDQNLGSDVEVVDEMPQGPNETEVAQMKNEERTESGRKVEAVKDAIKVFDTNSDKSVEKEGKAIDQLKADMFTDLISRVDTQLATAKSSSEKAEKLNKIKVSLENAKRNNGNPITMVENLRGIYGIGLAETIADELVSEKSLKKGLGDYINAEGFRTKAMAEYAKRFQSAGVSDEDIKKMINSGVEKGAGLGTYGM